MLDPEQPLRLLHDQFCALTGKQHRYEQWRHDWYEFSRFYTPDDLVVVIAYAERVNLKREKRYQIVTSLRKIIGDLRTFDDLLGEAQVDLKARAARKRAWQPSAADEVVSEFRKTDPQAPERGPVVARDVLLKNLSELKDKLEKQ